VRGFEDGGLGRQSPVEVDGVKLSVRGGVCLGIESKECGGMGIEKSSRNEGRGERKEEERKRSNKQKYQGIK
jgi:hypothetical protein